MSDKGWFVDDEVAALWVGALIVLALVLIWDLT
jgi:hypothetical protein